MLKIGWASADVTTNEPVGILGQAQLRISKGAMDPTTITALYMEDGGDYVLFLSGDFTSIDANFYNEFLAAVKERLPEFDGSKIIFNATHTHTAPWFRDGFPQLPKDDRLNIYPASKYRAFLIENLVNIVAEASQNAKTGAMSYGFGSATVGISRRSTYLYDRSIENTAENTFAVNGYAAMYGKTDNPGFAGYEGNVDTYVNLLFTFDENDKLTGAIVNVPCPSQCTEQEEFTSADFWHDTRKLIREKYGDIFILPQCACAGDLSPRQLHYLDALARRSQLCYGDNEIVKHFKEKPKYYNRLYIAEKIARAFDEGFAWATKEKFTDMPIKHVTKVIDLERWNVNELQYTEAKNSLAALEKVEFQHSDDPMADLDFNSRLCSNRTRSLSVIARYEDKSTTVPIEIHMLKIGDIAFTSNPFELYIDFQHRIQARSPFIQTFMVQLVATTTDKGAYLCTERAAANKGYSAISYSCNVSPAGGQTMVDEMVKTLQEIK